MRHADRVSRESKIMEPVKWFTRSGEMSSSYPNIFEAMSLVAMSASGTFASFFSAHR